jgi:hypothetical protein
MKELLESYGERLAGDIGLPPGSIYDGGDGADFRGVGPVLEQLLRKAEERKSWNETLEEVERFCIGFALAGQWQSLQSTAVIKNAEADIL